MNQNQTSVGTKESNPTGCISHHSVTDSVYDTVIELKSKIYEFFFLLFWRIYIGAQYNLSQNQISVGLFFC